METILLQRLNTIIQRIEALTEDAIKVLSMLSADNKTEAEIIVFKLETAIERFNTELYNYFKLSTDPSSDEISELTAIQLRGEETLSELKCMIKSTSVTPSTLDKPTQPHSGNLPKLQLPIFESNVLQWHEFWDRFSSNIDQRNLPEVDKFLYLKSALQGEARRIVEGLATTHKNYQIAVDALKERYGKKSQLIDAHYSALYNIEAAVTSSDSRKTLGELERHLRVLESLGEDSTQNHLRFLIMEKFPEDIIYEMKLKTNCESTVEMRKILNIIISAREEANRSTQINKNKKPSSYTIETLHVGERGFKRNQPMIKGRRFLNQPRQQYTNGPRNFNAKFNHNKNNKRPHHQNGQNRNNKRMKYQCIFCKQSHFSDECNVVKTLNERKMKLKDRCYSCLRLGHTIDNCRTKVTCAHCGKFGLHHRALCAHKIKGKVERTNTYSINENSSTALQTAIAQVRGPNVETLNCRILFDSGSQRSYVTQEIANKLELPIEENNILSIFTFGSETPKELESPIVKLCIYTLSNKLKSIYVNVVPTIAQGIAHPGKKLKEFNNLNLPLADDGSLSDKIDILIGNDYYFSFMTMRKKELSENLFLVESELGWIMSGKIEERTKDKLSVITYFQSCMETKLNPPDLPLDKGDFKLLWDLESLGITDLPKASRDEEAINNFNKTTQLVENRYAVCWPWNEYPPTLPSNFGLAFGRLVSQLKRLDSEKLTSYDATLKDQLEKGIIEIVPEQKRTSENYPIHYLPHHGVIQPGKPTRIVYDASAKTKHNKSLNECLYCGPMMLEDLTGLLLRFRMHPIALSADVEKAFLQIALQEHDRDVTRFLWLKDIEQPATEENLIHMRFCRIPFGIISSPFLLNATIRHHLLQSDKETIKQIASDIYVDNLLKGVESTQEAKELYDEVKKEFQTISMNLREWSSNSKEFMMNISDSCKDKIVKILGLDWTLDDDTIQLRVKKINTEANTKRKVLKVIASIYDPCGFAAPSLLRAKLMLQELWKQKVKWDSTLSDEMKAEWIEIRKELEDIKEISLTRCYLSNKLNSEIQIHCFTDASTKAYSAVIYLVNNNKINFVIGKSRMVPIKDQDNLKIPRLELLGVLIGCRLLKYVVKSLQLEIQHKTLWTDSQIVIDWYNSNKLLAPFVQRRIDEIKKSKDLTVRHVPSELNPADVATRPSCSSEDRNKWLSGPEFILQPSNTWPVRSSKELSFLVGEGLSRKKSNNILTKETVEIQTNTDKQESLGQVNECHGNQIKEILKLQEEYFTDELNGKETNLSRNLGLFKDIDGILRCKGRLRNTDWSFDKRYPILLPKDCYHTEKIIKQTHEKNYHVGANHTLSLIRENYWIPQGKSKVQKVLRKCLKCIKHGGGPFKLPVTPALPPERVNFSMPFTFTGVDYLGPVLVNHRNGTSKRWICLFTCLAVRAVHLETVQDLSAEEGLMALRRMISTRGLPTLVTSDNAVHFKLIAEILSSNYCVENKIGWRFIPALAPWFGGFYERLVGMVKHCMKRTLQKHLLNDSQLTTIIKEIEAVLNSRPLTCVDTELEHILKPSDFLNLGRCITMETTSKEPLLQGTTTKLDLIKTWKGSRVILREFQEMFNNRYLQSLRERYQHSHKDPRVTSKLYPKVGQIVQIMENKNREGWKVGKITELIKGTDNLCRVAKVKVGNTIFTRSISHLYPLEIEEQECGIELMEDNSEESRGINENIVDNFVEIENIPESIEKNIYNPKTSNKSVIDEVKTSETSQKNNEIMDTDMTIEETEPRTNLIEDKTNEICENDTTSEKTPRRQAAVHALEKIREWTRSMLSTLL